MYEPNIKMPKKLTARKKAAFIKDEKKAAKEYRKYSKPIKGIAKDETSHAKIISRIKTKNAKK
jgi:hypothetical protein